LDRLVKTSRAEVLAVVQARSGSKSIPRKNARPLAGHPLVAYSIAAGLDSRSVTRLIISTDDPELAAIAKDYGAEAPFMRPEALARDETPDLPLFQHALRWLKEREGYEPDVVVQLRPTAPLRPAGLVDQAVEALLANARADSVRSVTVANQNPYKMWKLREDGFLQPLLEPRGLREPYNMPRQTLPQTLWQTGHIEAIRRETILNHNSLTGQLVLPIFIDRCYSVDIDTEADWEYANWILENGGLVALKPESRSAALAKISKRPLPSKLSLLAVDFDGVLTDNRVWVTELGTESVACNRSDGLAIEMLRDDGIEVFVLSKESNPVVAARCNKLGVAFHQGVENKHAALQSIATERRVDLAQTAYVGNDVNDLLCMASSGCGIAVADAHPEVLRQADIVLKIPGGRGAIREVCDLILATRRHVERATP
jgi:N-acylneuraminate cytidylyltransferase